MPVYFTQTAMMYQDTAPQNANDQQILVPSSEMLSYLTSTPITRDDCWTETFLLRTASTGTGGAYS